MQILQFAKTQLFVENIGTYQVLYKSFVFWGFTQYWPLEMWLEAASNLCNIQCIYKKPLALIQHSLSSVPNSTVGIALKVTRAPKIAIQKSKL